MSEFSDDYLDEGIIIHSEVFNEDIDNVGWEPEEVEDEYTDDNTFGYFD